MMRPRVGVGVLVKKDGKILVQRRKNAHGAETWELPGGHMEYGETPEQTAARETKEEVNVEITNAKIVGITNDFMPDEQKHYITIFVEAEYAGGEIKAADTEHVAEISWSTLENMPEPLFLPLKNFLENKRLL